MKRVFSLILSILLIISLAACAKLNKQQQPLADMFFDNRSEWEKIGDDYCVSLEIYPADEGISIACGYGSSSTDGGYYGSGSTVGVYASSSTVVWLRAFRVSEDTFEVDPKPPAFSSATPYRSVTMNKDDMDNYNFSKSLALSSYDYNKSDNTKKKIIEDLVSHYEP